MFRSQGRVDGRGQDSNSAWSGEGTQQRGDWTIWPLGLHACPPPPPPPPHTHPYKPCLSPNLTPPRPQASSTPPPPPSIPPVARAPDGNPPQCSSSLHVLISSPAPRLHVAPTSLGPGRYSHRPLPSLPHPSAHNYNPHQPQTLSSSTTTTTTKMVRARACVCVQRGEE